MTSFPVAIWLYISSEKKNNNTHCYYEFNLAEKNMMCVG